MKVFPDQRLPKQAKEGPIRMDVAGNEYESVQLVVKSSVVLQNVEVELTDLVHENAEDRIYPSAFRISRVGFVKTQKPGYKVSHVGWWPDPLLKEASFELKKNWMQPFWLTLYISQRTKPGLYQGKALVKSEGQVLREVSIIVHVLSFDLPNQPSLKTAFALYENRIEYGYSQFFPKWWEKWKGKLPELVELFYNSLLEYRISPVINVNPINPKEVFRHQLDMSKYPQAPSLQLDHPVLPNLLEKGLSSFAIGPHAGTFGNNWPKDSSALQALKPLYAGYAAELKDKGWLDEHYVYTFDEPGLKVMPQVAEVSKMIHSADSKLKNLVVIGGKIDLPKRLPHLEDVDIVVIRNREFDPRDAEILRKKGKEVWTYVSGPAPPYPTFAIDYPAISYRVLAWMCWKYQVQGLLYWTVNYWTTDPYQDPANTRWQQNGNGLLYYPGEEGPVPSIRLEIIRDGIEDYEYLARLKSWTSWIRENIDLSANTTLRKQIQEAEAILRVPGQIAISMKRYSPDTTRLLAARRIIAELIEEFASYRV